MKYILTIITIITAMLGFSKLNGRAKYRKGKDDAFNATVNLLNKKRIKNAKTSKKIDKDVSNLSRAALVSELRS